MKLIALRKIIAVGLLALGICGQVGAIELSEREMVYLEKIYSASEIDRRGMSVYLSGLGATRLIRTAIQSGLISPDAKFEETLLTAAATNGRLETVTMLIQEGADIELKDDFRDTPVKAAARAGQVEVVNTLLIKGANPNSEGKRGSTPLSSATYGGHIDVVRALINGGATIQSNDERWSLVHYAARYGHSELIEYYVGRGVDINQRTNKGLTALSLAAGAGHSNAVGKLVAHKADINSLTSKKQSPLMLASKKGFPDIVSILLAGGARVDLEDEDGRSALWWAASRGNERVIKLLHKKKARANSALSLFAVKGDLQSLETLFASGIPLEQTDTEGEPGLHIAARYGHLDIVKFYLNKGMDIHSTRAERLYSPASRFRLRAGSGSEILA